MADNLIPNELISDPEVTPEDLEIPGTAEDIPAISDDSPKVIGGTSDDSNADSDILQELLDFTSPDKPEPLRLTVKDYGEIMVSSIPIGFLSGAIIMIVGFTIHGIVKIIKTSL